MDSQKPNNFEEEWQKAFNDASFTPPSDMWERIEQDLERKKRRPFLFFLRPSAMLAGLAATLVLALGGILYFSQKDSPILGAANTKTKNKPNSDIQNIQPNFNTENGINLTEKASDINTQNNEQLALVETILNKEVTTNSKKVSKNNQLPALASAGFTNLNTGNVVADAPKSDNKILDKLNNQIIDNQVSRSNILSQNDNKTNTNLSLLKPREYQYLGSRYTLKRERLVFDAEVAETQIIASNDSKFWLGLQSGVSPFDPNMKLGGLNTVALAQADAFAKNSNTASVGASPSVGDKGGNVMVSQPQNAIRSGIGINTGVAMGYKISKKWNFESGIRYLRGNSTLNSNTYAFQQNGYVNTFFADYLMQSTGNQTNTVVSDASQFGNRYEYLMIPLQVGYEIGLSKKVALNILAGVSTDIFLQNTIINDNSIVQEKSTINLSSNIYKPLNLSGLGGVRASYLISEHWQLNLGSSYQHSLFSGINNSTALQMRLKMFGLNYGLNYRF